MAIQEEKHVSLYNVFGGISFKFCFFRLYLSRYQAIGTRAYISAYRIQTTESGVAVAADPFSSKQKCEQGFTIDLTEQGFVPVLSVFENQTQDNILLVKYDIELVDSQGNVRKPVAANVMVSKLIYDTSDVPDIEQNSE